MKLDWPAAGGKPPGRALIRCQPEDFQVEELAGFELSGEGEHAFLWLEKRDLNTPDVAVRLAQLAAVPLRDVGFAGMKDRNAVTRQWFSVGLAGKQEPNWTVLEKDGGIRVLATGRHRRKLRRGNHRGNRFELVLRALEGDRAMLEQRLRRVKAQGAPNYFGPQRFGRSGATLAGAQRWMRSGAKVSRNKRGLYLSALRAFLFNELLAQKVVSGDWNKIYSNEVCMLQGSNSFFNCSEADDDIVARLQRGDLHPGLPLWGKEKEEGVRDAVNRCEEALHGHDEARRFLVDQGVDLAWRPTRLMPDDFCWQFCDDGRLQLEFALGAGSYATALLAECVQCADGSVMSGIGSEQG